MIKKEDFIKKTLEILKKDFEKNLPEEDTLDNMISKGNKIMEERFLI